MDGLEYRDHQVLAWGRALGAVLLHIAEAMGIEVAERVKEQVAQNEVASNDEERYGRMALVEVNAGASDWG